MQHTAGGWLHAIESSGAGLLVRDAVWLYPAANVLHVLAALVFFAAVAVMDLRVLGLAGGDPVRPTLARFRRVAVAAFLAMLASGGVLFLAEATALGANPSFQVKLVLIALGLANVLWLEASLSRAAPGAVPGAARRAAMLSLVLWLGVAACGRFIAYV